MKSLRFLDRRVGSLLASFGLLLGVAAPSLLPAFASADQLAGRSLQMSSSTASATGVTYDFNFTAGTAITAGGGVVFQFCDDSPLIGQACNAPGDMDASAATLTDVKVATTSLAGNKGAITKTASTITWTAASGGVYTGGQAVEFIFGGITNPSAANSSLYARIVTYANSTDLADYASATDIGTTHADDGGIATSITNNIGVTAAVKETMTFCVSKAAPDAGCAGTVTSPDLKLGHNTPLALDASQVDSDTAYAQLSTNAASGAVVSMKNGNSCGGLHRIGASAGVCSIPGIGSTAIAIPTNSTGGFGLNLDTATDAANGTAFGDIILAGGYSGGTTLYGMDTTATTSDYGDPIFTSDSAPVGNKNVPLKFGAAAGTTTPAGTYTASINLIATGTY